MTKKTNRVILEIVFNRPDLRTINIITNSIAKVITDEIFTSKERSRNSKKEVEKNAFLEVQTK